MPAPKGHPMWGNPRKPKKFTPDEFWEKALEYFKWCDENPFYRAEVVKRKISRDEEEVLLMDVPVRRPYTLEAFCTFADIDFQTFENYANREGYETYFDICTRIRTICRTNKLEGAMTGFFNASIVARDLGLKEHAEISGGSTIKIGFSEDE